MSDTEPISTAAVFGAMTFASAPGVEHVAVAGGLCTATVAQLELALAAVSPDSLVIVLDLSAVTDIDDAARRAIHAAVRRFHADRRRMVLIASASVRRSLDGAPESREQLARCRACERSGADRPRMRGCHLVPPARARLPRRALCQ